MPDAEPRVVALPNGVRVLTLALPQLQTASVSVFVRAGSQNESRRLNGISHVVEHMAFKGTSTRDCQRINLDAERLGAEVNAHTDKDHTAFHIDGRARDAEAFVRMLGDIVLDSTFPEAELERERQVILHEITEDEDDPLASTYKLFDRVCYGHHPRAQPVIGRRANVERCTRDDLLAHLRRHYTAGNIVVAVAGGVDAERIARAAEAAFGAMPAHAAAPPVPPPPWQGGLRTRRLGGSAQTHAVLGFPIPALAEDHAAQVVAAALFGEGMSSPLLDRIREQLGLAYYIHCAADVSALCGQFVVEASTSPEQAQPLLAEVLQLLRQQAGSTDPVALERARNQLAVRALRDAERPARRLETAVLDLYALGHVRSAAQALARIEAVTAVQVREAFASMLGAPAALALAGRLATGLKESAAALLPAARTP